MVQMPSSSTSSLRLEAPCPSDAELRLPLDRSCVDSKSLFINVGHHEAYNISVKASKHQDLQEHEGPAAAARVYITQNRGEGGRCVGQYARFDSAVVIKRLGSTIGIVCCVRNRLQCELLPLAWDTLPAAHSSDLVLELANLPSTCARRAERIWSSLCTFRSGDVREELTVW